MKGNGIKIITSSVFAANAGWILLAQVYQMALSLLVGVLCARYLGPDNYGVINYVASFVSLFTVICSLGLEGVVVKEILSDFSNEGVVIGSSIVLRFAAGMLSMIAVCMLSVALGNGQDNLIAVAFLESISLLFSSVQIIEYWYQSRMRSRTPSIVRCVAYSVMTLYRVILLISGKDVLWFAFATSLDSIVIAVLFLVRYNKDSNNKLSCSFQRSKQLLSQSYHLVISSLMAVLYSQLDRVIVGQMLGMGSVGLYTAAATIYNVWMVVPKAISDAARPIIMQQKIDDPSGYKISLQKLIAALFWLGVIFCIFVIIVSEQLVCFLFGEDYSDAASVLCLIIGSSIFAGISYPRTIWMICENKQQHAKHIMVWGVIANLILNLALIPLFGIIGSGIAMLITEFLCCFVTPFAYKNTREFVILLIKACAFRWVQ